MSEAMIDVMMRALDPARDVSDAVLGELSPESKFWMRLDLAGAGRETRRHRRRWLAVPGAAAAAAALLAVLWTPTGSPPARPALSSAPVLVVAQNLERTFDYGVNNQGVAAGSLKGPYWSSPWAPTPGQIAIRKLPLCAQSQVVETLSVARASLSTRVWYFTLNLNNISSSCRVAPRMWVPEGVTGPAHLAIYLGWSMAIPVLARTAITWVRLRAHTTWHLHFRVLSPWSAAFVVQQDAHPGPGSHVCSSRLANGFVEAGMNARWTDAYFHLPFRVPVCREGLFNIQGDTAFIPRGTS